MSKLIDTQQLDWVAAKIAAKRIESLCEEAWYIAPEGLAEHRTQIQAVRVQMNQIVAALLIRQPPAAAFATAAVNTADGASVLPVVSDNEVVG